MKMRVFLAIICSAILSTTVFAEGDFAPRSNRHEVELKETTESTTQLFWPFRKKKKRAKTSGKMKRHNKSMGKKFKRKNDDTLRR